MDRHPNVVQLHPQRTSDWLEALARQPFALHRELLLDLAERVRAIEAVQDEHVQVEPREAA
jgi:hypothetical protein